MRGDNLPQLILRHLRSKIVYQHTRTACVFHQLLQFNVTFLTVSCLGAPPPHPPPTHTYPPPPTSPLHIPIPLEKCLRFEKALRSYLFKNTKFIQRTLLWNREREGGGSKGREGKQGEGEIQGREREREREREGERGGTGDREREREGGGGGGEKCNKTR